MTDLLVWLNRLVAVIIGIAGVATAVWALDGHQVVAGWVQVDALGAVFLAVNAVVGLCSALASETYLAQTETAIFAAGPRWYWLGFYLFWAALLALPLVTNLGSAWLLVEASTGASALLVAYSGKRRALEAGWKYLVLTTLGLAVALLGIVYLYAAVDPGARSLSALDWQALAGLAPHLPHSTLALAFVLIIGGLAAKVGWAPVHHWLPDAHSEAPAPVSAMLSAALLPSVILVAWRLKLAVGGAIDPTTSNGLFLAFGLLSLVVAIPFLWQPMPIKRLLAYSSLEHVGLIAVGIGFNQPLAVIGIVLHVWGHAVFKSAGFYASMPLFSLQPSAAWRPATGIARVERRTGAAIGVSLLGLSGLPPSPLFVSELLILLGGVEAGQLWVTGVAVVLLALGFIGLVHQTIEVLFARPQRPAVVTPLEAAS